jgi:hypothetical protein
MRASGAADFCCPVLKILGAAAMVVLEKNDLARMTLVNQGKVIAQEVVAGPALSVIL